MKRPRSVRLLKKAATFGMLSLTTSVLPYAHAFAIDQGALPSGGVVVGGSASFDYSKQDQLHVHQGTDRAVINWDSFNIGEGALTQFHQLNSSSLVVNRVTGGNQDPTKILGTLKANGRVMVLDRNGVLFGHNSRVDAASIIVSTGDIDTNAVMNGDMTLQLSNIGTDGAVVNHGNITVAEAGLAAFVAPTVTNSGIIQAKLGRIQLASGTSATLDLYGDGLVEVAVDEPMQKSLVDNNGVLHAEGGTIVLTAAAAKDVVNSTINMSGIVNASSATQKGGKIILGGGNDIAISGTLDASGKTGGGTIHAGGGWQGKDETINNAKNVTVSSPAKITANTSDSHGNGGEVVVWADENTQFNGTIEAKGGSLAGDGGKVETSGKKNLQVDLDAKVIVAAANAVGYGGEWLIDPEDIVISNSGNDGDGATSDIAASTINNTLNTGGNVTITTNAMLAGTGDITLSNANILKSTSNNDVTLTLQAHRNIVMSNSTINSTSSDKLNVVFNADRDANLDGAISMASSSILSNGGDITLGGGSGTISTSVLNADGSLNTAAQGFAVGNTAYVHGVNISGTIDASGASTGGNILINGYGFNTNVDTYGIQLIGSTIKTNHSGAVRMNGVGDGTARANGIRVVSTSDISTVDGELALFGTTTSLPSLIFTTGLSINASTVRSTGAGDIFVTGISNTDEFSSTNYGVSLNNASVQATGTGAITAYGNSGNGDSSSNSVGVFLNNNSSIKGNGSLIRITGNGGLVKGGSEYGIRVSSSTLSNIGAGEVILTGTNAGRVASRNYGIYVDTAGVISTVSGDLTVNGTGGGTATSNSNYGVYITGADSSIKTTGGGTLRVSGTGGSGTGGSNHGVYINAAGGLQTIGGGSIIVDGTAGAGASSRGIYITATDGVLTTGSGNITLKSDNISLAATNAINSAAIANLMGYASSSTIGISGGIGTLMLTDATLSNIAASTLIIGDSLNGTGDITVDSWDISGKTYNVELYGNDITFQDTDNTAGVDYALKLGTGNFMAHAHDNDGGADKAQLSVNAAIQKQVGGTSLLDLRSDRDIALTVGNIAATTGTLNLVLNADRDADQDGAILIANSSITTNNGWLVAGGGSGTLWGADGLKGTSDDIASTGADNVAAWGNNGRSNGIGVSSSTISTGSGLISMIGKASSDLTTGAGIYVFNSSILANAGNITLTGRGGTASSGYSGVFINGSSLIETNEGDITLSGYAMGPGDNTASDIERGLAITGSIVRTLTNTQGKGNITILGDATASTATAGRGLEIISGSTIETQAGDITVTGRKGVGNFAIGTWLSNTIASENGGNILLDGGNGTIFLNADGGVNPNTHIATIGHANTKSLEIIATDFFIHTALNAATSVSGKTILLKHSDNTANITIGGSGFLTDYEATFINASDKFIIGDSSNAKGDITVDSWDISGKTYNVELYGNDITFQDTDNTAGVDYALKLGTGNFMAHAMDNAAIDLSSLNINAAVVKSQANTSLVDLRSDQDIVFNSSGITATAGILNVALNADRDADQDGAIDINSSTFTTNGGWFVAGGGSGALWGSDGTKGTADDATSTGADNVSAWGNVDRYNGVRFYNSSLNAGGGDIRVHGHGWNGSTTTNNTLSAAGIRLRGSAFSTQNDGGIFMDGVGGGTGASNYNIGVYIMENSSATTYAGDIDLIGAAGGGSGNSNIGISISSVGTNFLRSTLGDINLTGSGASLGIVAAGRIESLGSSDINLLATSGRLQTTGNVGGNNATGHIHYTANEIEIGGGTVKTTGNVLINSYSPATAINLGNVTTGVALSSSEMGRISAAKVIIGNDTDPVSDVLIDALDISSTSYDLEIYGNDITLRDTDATPGVDYALNLGTGDFLAHAIDNDGDADKSLLAVNAAIQKQVDGTSLLDLRSDRDIVFTNGHIAATGTAVLNIVLNADRDADHDGRIALATSDIVTNNGWFVAGGGSGTLWGADGIKGTSDDADSMGADKIAAWGNSGGLSGITVNGSIGTGTADILLTGRGGNGNDHRGVTVDGGTLETSSGTMTITGYGGSGISGVSGVLITNNSVLETDEGDIDVFGYGAGADVSNLNRSIQISSGSIVRSTTNTAGKGNIRFYGDASDSTAPTGRGFEIYGNSTISTEAGNIYITGRRGNGTNSIYLGYTGSVVESRNGGNIYVDAGDSALVMTTQNNTYTSVLGHAQTGLIDIVADDIVFSAQSSLYADTINIKPYTNSRTINMGIEGSGLNLSDTDLARMFANDDLVIGDPANSTGNINIDSWDLSAKTHNVQVHGNDMNVGGITTGSGDVILYSKGANGITVSANSLSNGTGDLILLAAGPVRVNQRLENTGTGHINLFAGWDGSSGLTTPALFDTDDIDFGVIARNVTIGANGTIKSGGTGTAVLVAATGNFLNNASNGANAVQTSAGRYLVYGTHPDDTAKGGLTAKNLYNQSYATHLPSSVTGASRFIFMHQPTLTLRADNIAYGAPQIYKYSPVNLRTGDLLADVVTGTPTYTLGALTNGTQEIQMGLGTLASPMGYNIVVSNGTLQVAEPVSQSPTPSVKPVLEKVAHNTVSISEEKQDIISANYADETGSSGPGGSADCLVTDGSSGACLVN